MLSALRKESADSSGVVHSTRDGQAHWVRILQDSLTTRFYHSCQAVGAMLSGALQTAIHESMGDAHGIKGWQWTVGTTLSPAQINRY